jgi:hypothetical protein
LLPLPAVSFCAAVKLGASSPVLEPASTWNQTAPARSDRLLDQRRHLGVNLGHRSRLAIGTADRHAQHLDQIGMAPLDWGIGSHCLARWCDGGEVPALRGREHPAAGFFGRDHDVDDRPLRAAAREVQRGAFAIGAGRGEHDLDAGQVRSAAGFEDAPPDRRDRPIEGGLQVAGSGCADQLLPERVGCGVGLRRDRRCGRGAERQRFEARTRGAAVSVQAGRRVDLEPTAAARAQQLLERRGECLQLVEAITPLAGARPAGEASARAPALPKA